MKSVPQVADPHAKDLPLLASGEREQIWAAVQGILTSSSFSSSSQNQSLLRYVVEHSIARDEALLRERVIGKEVFHRPADYEPGEDPVVRIRVADLRKRLAIYYQANPSASPRISIPVGGYRAAFEFLAPPKQEEAAVAPDAEIVPARAEPEQQVPAPIVQVSPSPARRNRRVILTLGIVFAVVLALLGIRFYSARPHGAVQQFWSPLLTANSPVLLSVGSNAVYRLSESFSDNYVKEHHLEASGMEFFPTLDPHQTVGSIGLHPAADSFVALGDVAAVAEITRTLTGLNKPQQIRFSNDISFAEVRSNPTVSIGGFNNQMTREFTKKLRFTLTSRNRIDDHLNPGQSWLLNASNDSHDTEDYALITRLLVGNATGPFLSLAGMGQYGTLAATDFVCDEESLKKLARLAPNWQHQNLQAVLRIKVVDYKAVSTEIVAVHTW